MLVIPRFQARTPALPPSRNHQIWRSQARPRKASSFSTSQAIRKIKADHVETKVLLFSMDKEAEYLNQTLSKRAEGYVIKESVNNELLRAIGTVKEGSPCQEMPLRRRRCMRQTSRRPCFWGEVVEPCATPTHQGVCGDRGRCLLGRRRDEPQHVCIRPRQSTENRPRPRFSSTHRAHVPKHGMRVVFV